MSDKVRVKSRGRDRGCQRTSRLSRHLQAIPLERLSAIFWRSNYGCLPPLALHCNPNFISKLGCGIAGTCILQRAL